MIETNWIWIESEYEQEIPGGGGGPPKKKKGGGGGGGGLPYKKDGAAYRKS